MENATGFAIKSFFGAFGSVNGAPEVFFAPGRVNLIGDHTDYNGGFVLPMTISSGTCLAIRPNSSGLIRLRSSAFPHGTDIGRDKIRKVFDPGWVNYPLGVMKEFVGLGVVHGGADMYFFGTMPTDAGLSSSASLEMVTAFALNEI